MAQIISYSDFSFERQIAEAAQTHLKFLIDSNAELTCRLADVMLESREHPEIDEILKHLDFVRRLIREYYEGSKSSLSTSN